MAPCGSTLVVVIWQESIITPSSRLATMIVLTPLAKVSLVATLRHFHTSYVPSSPSSWFGRSARRTQKLLPQPFGHSVRAQKVY